MHGALMAESPNGAIRSGENGINNYLWCALIIPNKVCVSKEFILGSRPLLRENTVATCISDRSVDFSHEKVCSKR